MSITLANIVPLIRSSKMKPDVNYYGIEVELENVPEINSTTLNKLNKAYWCLKEDSSLINGIEFVSSILSYDEVTSSLAVLEDTLSSINTPKEQGIRTSVHVHVDCTLLTPEDIARFVCGFYIMEKFAFSMTKSARKVSNFCVPLRKSPKDVLYLLEHLDSIINVKYVANKYRALNMASLFQYGTLECRIMDGTYSSRRILEMVNFLHWLKQVCQQQADELPHVWVDWFVEQAKKYTEGRFCKSIDEGAELIKSMLYEYKPSDCVVDKPIPIIQNYKNKYLKEIAKDVKKKVNPADTSALTQWISSPFINEIDF